MPLSKFESRLKEDPSFYLLPLAVLELYFLASRSPSVFAKFATAALVLAAAGATSIGVYGTTMRWLS